MILVERVEVALAEASALHKRVIRMSPAEVEEMFMRGVGWLPPAGQRKGCGTFAARVYAQAGLRADVRKYAMASTRRLYRFARGLTISGKWTPPKTAVSRIVDPKDTQRGDIVIIRTSQGLVEGDHVTVATDFDGKAVGTVEYNASGKLGNGQVGRGVVVNRRPIEKVAWVYRLQDEDFA